MKQRIMNNIVLKIISVFLAILVWLTVVNIDDPIIPRQIDNVVVRVQNGAYIEDMRKTYRIEENKNLISVVVRGKRSVVEKLTASDISAVADMTQIISFDTVPIMVPVQISCEKVSQENISSNTKAIEVIIEDLKTKEFIITPSALERPGKGFEIGVLQASPEKITISGPESTIEKISKVIAPINVNGDTVNKVEEVSLRIIDKNQEPMKESQTQYLKFNGVDTKVKVDVTLWKVVNNIKIEAEYTGKAADGFKVNEVVTTPSEISIAGSDDALKQLMEDGNVIKIPGDLVDVTDKKADFEQKIDISKYLKENTKLPTDVSNNIIVNVTILPLGSKEYEILTKDILVDNRMNDFNVGFVSEKILIRIKGLTKELEKLTTNQIKATVDLKGLVEGEHNVPVNIILPEGYELVEPVTVTLKLEKTVES